MDYIGAYPRDSVIDPRGPNEGYNRVYRGGSYSNSRGMVASAIRDASYNPGGRYAGFGFRIALKQVD